MTPEHHVTALLPEPGEPPETVSTLLAAIRKAGRTRDQAVYEAAYYEVFEHLDVLDGRLGEARYLGGTAPSAEDWWAFAVLIRFDLAYYNFYKLNRQRLEDFDNLGPWLRDLYQRDGIAETVDLRAIREHYAAEDEGTNPKGLTPVGLGPDLRTPHDRFRFDAAVDTERGVQEDPSRPRRPGEWVRPASGHRDFISVEGSTGFPAEAGRYHLYIANNCPWSHRTALARSILGLTDVITMDVLYWRRDPEHGWQFRPEAPDCTPDTLFGSHYLREIYRRVGSDEKSVPVLFDRVTNTIVNNESAEIVRMLNGAFATLGNGHHDLYPQAHRAEIDHLNGYVYQYVNNGAYKAGFTSSQAVHDTWSRYVFRALDWLDRRLADRQWLVGDALTEADLRLFPTIYRFDPVYVIRFRLDQRRIATYPNLTRWLSQMLDVPGVREASNLQHCKNGYFGRTGNELVPVGPADPLA